MPESDTTKSDTTRSGITRSDTTKSGSTKSAINVRLDEDLLKAIDARAKDVGLSRNAWIERAAQWVIQSLPTRADPEVAHQAALNAPVEVAGYQRVDMGLET